MCNCVMCNCPICKAGKCDKKKGICLTEEMIEEIPKRAKDAFLRFNKWWNDQPNKEKVNMKDIPIGITEAFRTFTMATITGFKKKRYSDTCYAKRMIEMMS